MSLTRRQTAAAIAALPLALATTPAVAHGGAARRPRTVHIAGDSTAAPKYADAAPETGWGMALPFFLSRTLSVANHAMNGRSSKSFTDEGLLAALLDTRTLTARDIRRLDGHVPEAWISWPQA